MDRADNPEVNSQMPQRRRGPEGGASGGLSIRHLWRGPRGRRRRIANRKRSHRGFGRSVPAGPLLDGGNGGRVGTPGQADVRQLGGRSHGQGQRLPAGKDHAPHPGPEIPPPSQDLGRGQQSAGGLEPVGGEGNPGPGGGLPPGRGQTGRGAPLPHQPAGERHAHLAEGGLRVARPPDLPQPLGQTEGRPGLFLAGPLDQVDQEGRPPQQADQPKGQDQPQAGLASRGSVQETSLKTSR